MTLVIYNTGVSMDHLKVAIGCDHGGFNYKQKIIDYLKSRNIEYTDVGTYKREA